MPAVHTWLVRRTIETRVSATTAADAIEKVSEEVPAYSRNREVDVIHVRAVREDKILDPE
jgi:hypothetical protein